MKPPRKTAPAPAPSAASRRPPQTRAPFVAHKQRPHAHTLQLKPASTHSTHKPPTAPPVYRPNPQPKVLQRKAASPQPPRAACVTPTLAPPVYRPLAAPKVLQRKTHVGTHGPAPTPERVSAPAPPPAYRPNPAPRVLQLKSAAPAPTAATPPAQPFTARRFPVIQRMLELDSGPMYNLPFGGGGGDDEEPDRNKPPVKGHYIDKFSVPKKKKRKKRDDGISEENLVGSRQRKGTLKQSAHMKLNRVSVSRSSMGTRGKETRLEMERDYDERGILPEAPPIQPVTDVRGYAIWNGHRNSIGWYPNFLTDWWNAHQPKNHTACVYNHEGGCGGDMEVDHAEPAVNYILNIFGVAPEVVCDGAHHWAAYVLDTPTTVNSSYPLSRYDGGRQTIRTAYHHNENLQAICQHHNGSKGSHRRGLDDPHPPAYVGPCDCEHRGATPLKKARRKSNKKDDL